MARDREREDGSVLLGFLENLSGLPVRALEIPDTQRHRGLFKYCLFKFDLNVINYDQSLLKRKEGNNERIFLLLYHRGIYDILGKLRNDANVVWKEDFRKTNQIICCCLSK